MNKSFLKRVTSERKRENDCRAKFVPFSESACAPNCVFTVMPFHHHNGWPWLLHYALKRINSICRNIVTSSLHIAEVTNTSSASNEVFHISPKRHLMNNMWLAIFLSCCPRGVSQALIKAEDLFFYSLHLSALGFVAHAREAFAG